MLAPIAGPRSSGVLCASQSQYLALVDYTGRQIRPDKGGAITGPPLAILLRRDYRSEQWTRQLLAVGAHFAHRDRSFRFNVTGYC